MKLYNIFFLLLWSILMGCNEENVEVKKVVILAGAKSHTAGEHEYIKSARLIKVMLERELPGEILVDIFYDWPEDVAILDSASLIMCISDGRDGDLYKEASFLQPERVPIIAKQMERGCGLVTFHFSTFAPDVHGEQVLQWAGGYFDWQDDKGDRNWFSAIQHLEADVIPLSAEHPVCNGVQPFQLKEEFYYNMRFQDIGWTPLLSVPALNSEQTNGKVVAWAIERPDESRGFGTTMGHHFSNWENNNFRKFVLNGIVWAAGLEVPNEGIGARFYTDWEVTRILFGREKKALILTGDNIELHEWSKTTEALVSLFDASSFHADVSTNISDLGQYNLKDYDVLVLNYCNWNNPDPLTEHDKKSFTEYLSNGGGLMILHFANGAFHSSLPEAGSSDWPEYRNICRRIWDHNSNSAHDDYGTFTVDVHQPVHLITRNLSSFSTVDELYYNQKGTAPIDTLLSAQSKKTGNKEALAWHYRYGKGRVFQTLLGHNAASYESEGFRQVLLQAADWVATND